MDTALLTPAAVYEPLKFDLLAKCQISPQGNQVQPQLVDQVFSQADATERISTDIGALKK